MIQDFIDKIDDEDQLQSLFQSFGMYRNEFYNYNTITLGKLHCKFAQVLVKLRYFSYKYKEFGCQQYYELQYFCLIAFKEALAFTRSDIAEVFEYMLFLMQRKDARSIA